MISLLPVVGIGLLALACPLMMVGMGVVSPPMPCFEDAVRALKA